ncbi:hypothetical protein ABT154_25360 [Streptomyces sp. NPDC001728]|uniref:hypothetical protein n=1 Tax=Streptomyces sp. NPDC001728 TaxID=3154396 RepID=UPI00331E4ABD
MNNLLVGAFVVTAAGAVTAVVAAAQDDYGLCAVALFTVAAGAVGAYLISRSQAAATDRTVLHRLEESPTSPSMSSRTSLVFARPPSGSASPPDQGRRAFPESRSR